MTTSTRRSRPGTRRVPARARRAAVLTAPAALGVVAVLLAGGTTAAVLRANDVFAGGVITAGDLALTTGTPAYRQVTPGLAEPATPTTDPSALVTMPGDVVEIVVPVTADLEGDNLVADLTVGYSLPVPAGVRIAATYRVVDEGGAQMAPASGTAAAGSSVTLADLTGSDAGTHRGWSVVVLVQVLDDYQWVTPSAPATLTDWTAGRVTVRLDQVRRGPGYATGGGG